MLRVTRNIALVALAITAWPLDASPRGALVPWKVAQPGRVETSPLTLFWIPATGQEMRRSELLASDELTLYSSQCVRMRIVRIDDRARLVRLAGGEELPVVVLVDDTGAVIGKVAAQDGEIERDEVERLVRDELARRAAAADAMLDAARLKAEERDLDGAVALYRNVREARCTCPRQGRDATRALRKLRVSLRD